MDYTGLAQRLAEVHQFPCSYTIKLIGVTNVLLEQTIRDSVAGVLPGAEFTLSCRASTKDRFSSWTLDVTAPDVESVIALYTALQPLDGLKVLL
ncbi:DUF493 domain-containing protein [Myxococcota bacterium]|nr:DUF493 domain-containing protein [Myxococcota bacterium]